jgi:hypothetical protein
MNFKTANSFFLFLVFFLIQIGTVQAQAGKKIYLAPGNDRGVILVGDQTICKPGDTLVVKATPEPYSYIYLGKLKGSSESPITLINEGGVVYLNKGIDLEDCQYVKVTGSGSKDRFGFTVNQTPGAALVIRGKSSNIEAERFYIKDAAFGCWVKNEAQCDTLVNNWVLNHISIHDYEMHDIKIEGFYMGSTDANNIARPITCNGMQRFFRPSRLGNIKVYNGVINGTGRPAIMLSNASVGMNEIFNNTISNVGREYNDQQGTGISVGLYTRAFIHHNNIKNTYTWGIASLGGAGLIRIENNTIDSSGYLDNRSLSWPWNILVDTRETFPLEKTRFIIKNNILGKSGNKFNIYVGKTVNAYDTMNIICNNTVNGKPGKVDVEEGVRWRNCDLAQMPVEKKSMNPFLPAVIVSAGVLFYVLRKRRRSLMKKAVS